MIRLICAPTHLIIKEVTKIKRMVLVGWAVGDLVVSY